MYGAGSRLHLSLQKCGLPRTVLAAEACLFFSRPPKATATLKPLKPLSAPLAATLQRSLGNHQGQGELPRNDTLATAAHPAGPEGCLGCVAGLRSKAPRRV